MKQYPQPTLGMKTRFVKQNGAYSRRTTAEQRRKLFEVWEATGNVIEACQQAGTTMRTFYYWKTRFEQGGYAALEKVRSNAPKNPYRTPQEIETLIRLLHKNNYP